MQAAVRVEGAGGACWITVVVGACQSDQAFRLIPQRIASLIQHLCGAWRSLMLYHDHGRKLFAAIVSPRFFVAGLVSQLELAERWVLVL